MSDGHTDWMSVATLALTNESYQIHADDDAGVRLNSRIRGYFRQVICSACRWSVSRAS